MEAQIPTEGGAVLHAKLMTPKPPVQPQRVVLISPLVGASAAQPLLIFRNLTRRGCTLVSFEYRGHPRSSGRFELDRTVVDVRYALQWAWNYANERRLPLHGFATCYGAVPLLAQFREDGWGGVLRSFNTISGLFRLDQILRIGDFAAFFARQLGQRQGPEEILAQLAQQTFDGNGKAFRRALHEYLTNLFPGLRVGEDYFEELQYERVNIPQTLLQLSQARYLDGVRVPADMPCNIFLGRNDDVLSAHTPEGREAYRNRVLSLIPQAVVHVRDFDHFGRGAEHDAVIEHLADIFERHDGAPVPPHHLHAVGQAERAHGDERTSEFWNERYGVDRPLEADSRVARLLNRYVVAALMNAFPHAATKVFSLSKGELARLLFKERDGGSFRSLRAMYEYENPRNRGDLINRLLMQSPAIKAARNRRTIAQRLLARLFGRTALGLAGARAGGRRWRWKPRSGSDCPFAAARRLLLHRRYRRQNRRREPEGAAKAWPCGSRFRLRGHDCRHERHGECRPGRRKAIRRSLRRTEHHCLPRHHRILRHRIGSQPDTLATARGNSRLHTAEGNLIISQTDYHDRVKYLERGLSWHMRLRSREELAAEVEKTGWQISVCQHEPMRLITMCLAVKSDVPQRRVDSPSQVAQPRAKKSALAGTPAS